MDSKDERSSRSIDPGLRRKISISDDGAPDSVYVDGDLTGKGGSRRKVVIIDEDERSMPAANPAPRRSMDGRVRARRAAVRRALGRRRLVRPLGALAALVLGIAVLAVLGSSWFGVRSADVRVSGNVYTNPVQLNAIIDEVLGTPIVLVDTDAIEEQIDAIGLAGLLSAPIGHSRWSSISESVNQSCLFPDPMASSVCLTQTVACSMSLMGGHLNICSLPQMTPQTSE